MAIFECPGCKHIVDASIKKCPNCSYDIKKYVKMVLKDSKKNDKGEVSLPLSSVYDSSQNSASLPKLDFLSGISEPEPIAPAYEEPAAPAYEEPAAPAYEEPAAPVYEEPAAPVYEEPAAPVYEAPAATSFTTTAAPRSSIFSTVPAPQNFSKPSFPEYQENMPRQEAFIQNKIPEPTPVKSPENPLLSKRSLFDSGSAATIKVEAPASPAAERMPISSNPSSMFPKPIYQEESKKIIAPTHVTEPVVEAPIFDSPELNAAHANGIRPASPASAAVLPSMRVSFGAEPGYGSYQSKPLHGVAGGNTFANSAPAANKDENGEELLFDSPLLNAQHKKIQSGEYVPTSMASQATMSLLDRTPESYGQIKSGVSQSSFGLGSYGQTSTYKTNETVNMDPVLGGGNALLGSQQPVSPQTYQQNAFSSYGNTAAQSANPLIGGGNSNPLLGGGNNNPLYGGGQR